MALTQDNRPLAVETPLGKDVLLLQRFTGDEGVSRLFRFVLDMISEKPSIDFSSIVGRGVTVKIRLADDSVACYHGIVNRFSQGAGVPGAGCVTSYRAEVVPQAWLLTQNADCRIFQDMTAPDIITKVFNEAGLKDFKNQLQKSYPKLNYCVQYRESDFAFVSRLMEQFGIYYYFEHQPGVHKLVFTDNANGHQPCPCQAEAKYQTTHGATVGPRDVISAMSVEKQVVAGACALTDYNFEMPSTNLRVNVTGSEKSAAPRDVYDYPGLYITRDEGEGLVRSRIEEHEAYRTMAWGTSGCRGFRSGFKFKLTNHYRADMNVQYLLTSVAHSATQGGYGSGDDTEFAYSNEFSAVPLSVPFRPPMITPKPTIHSTQTAVVVGKQGEEIWVDKYGRIKVQFHWDRLGKKDENSSCWIRVAQSWAGKKWGAVFLPRIGQEVVVSFLEGDPDRPLVVGSVYNAEQVVPYDLPANQTRSTIKSNSSKGGGGFNEMRFEDKKGSEEIYVHAQKDQNIVIENDRTEKVGRDRHQTVGRNKHTVVKKDFDLQVDANRREAVYGSRHLTVAGEKREKVGGDKSVSVGGDLAEKVSGSDCLQAGKEIYIKAGMKVVIEAGMQITLKGPGGFVDVGPAGVTIQGSMVLINSGGAAGTGSKKDPKAPDPPTK